MYTIKIYSFLICFSLSLMVLACSEDSVEIPEKEEEPEEETEVGEFYFGSDLSYANQILDMGGVFTKDGEAVSPYKIFKDAGNDIVRLRLWHNPTWTKEVYGEQGMQLYNDLHDVEKAIKLSKEQGMTVLLDFHYSDAWADPLKQYIPAAWEEIDNITDLADSVYNYTYKTLSYLNDLGLMPEYVQIGNETNCGMLFSEAPEHFPACNVCEGGWANMATVLKRGIQAVRDVKEETQVILHVADPKNVSWWFTEAIKQGVTDFDIIGFSYYPIWHTEISVSQLSTTVAGFKSSFNKDIMILETAYPWTGEGNDNYNNLFGGQAVAGYPISLEGQQSILEHITQNVIDGGGIGVIYWEPAWISSDLKDLWGTGSAWENNAFFDFDGEANAGFDFMSHTYTSPE